MGTKWSPPLAGAWIEMIMTGHLPMLVPSRPPSRGRGLKYFLYPSLSGDNVSPPLAGAWIEIGAFQVIKIVATVAPPRGGVD